MPGIGNVTQYADTVTVGPVEYDPANNCRGYFTSHKYQVHNNCYNYALNIATNTMAYPGRKHGVPIDNHEGKIDRSRVLKGAEKDGLIVVDGIKTIDQLRSDRRRNGHWVALLIAPAAKAAGFPGDFHWVRCDDLRISHWSQKDGAGEITNFDFAGLPIFDPMRANWVLNNGPLDRTKPGQPDFKTTYKFITYMFVPHDGSVDII